MNNKNQSILIIGPLNHIHFKRTTENLNRILLPNAVEIIYLDILNRKFYLFQLIVLILRIRFIHFKVTKLNRRNINVYVHLAHSYGLAVFLSGIDYNLICWGSDVFNWKNSSKRPKKYVIKVLKKAQKIFSSSHYMKNHIFKISGKKAKIISIRPNIYFAANQKNNYEKTKINKLRFITIKSLFEIYGIIDFIEVIENLEQRYRDLIEYTIWGEGPLQNSINERIINSQLTGIIKLEGRAKQEDVEILLKNSDFLVSPSRDESYGVTCLEASALNLPIIGNKISAYQESTCQNINSILINLRTKKQKIILTRIIIDLLKNRQTVDEMKSKSRNLFIENFNLFSFNSEYFTKDL